MTITLNIPEDLERALRARAAGDEADLPETLLALLRDSVGGGNGHPRPGLTTIPMPLQPTLYPEEELLGLPAEGASYEAVPFPAVGRVGARFVMGGALTPTAVPESE